MKTTLQELDDKYLVTFDGDLDTAAAVFPKTHLILYHQNP